MSRRPRTVARSRVAGVVLAVLLVTAAAIGYRLSDPVSDNELVLAPLDQPVPFESGAIRVSDIRVGTTVRLGDDRVDTKGMFVVVQVAARATGRDKVRVGNERLLTRDGQATYLPSTTGNVVSADPGFETSQDIVFEVDPTRIDDLTLELWDSGILYRYYERTQTPLGITDTNAADWARAGAGRLVQVEQDGVTKAVS